MAGMPTMPGAAPGMLGAALRSPTPQGAPIILTSPRLQQASPHHIQPQVSLASLVNGGASGGPPPLVSPTDGSLLYSYDPYGLTTGAPLLEYPGLEQSGAGTSANSPYVR